MGYATTAIIVPLLDVG